MRQQPWYTGTFASIGASYQGYTQWALLDEPQPDHRAAVILVGAHDFRDFHWGPGSLTSTVPMWASIINDQETNQPRRVFDFATRGRRVYRLLRKAPIADTIAAAMPRQAAWVRDRITHDDPADPYWAPLDHSATLERASIPILIASGWQDLFVRQSLHQFERLTERGIDAAFTIGPWAHTTGAAGGPMQTRETFEWLAAKLAGSGPDRGARIHLHVTGVNEWRDLDSWPPAVEPLRLHLAPHDFANAPVDGEATFVFDPRGPAALSRRNAARRRRLCR